MAKTPEELEQIREHNRKVLRELQFDPAKWLPVPRAIRALVPVLEPDLQAAAELHKRMRNPSDAIPTATRSCRWHDGVQTSHVITGYPSPAYWDAVPPGSLIRDFREISEGDGNVVRCWDYVDLQCFNRWFSVLAEQAERAERAKQAGQAGQAEQEPLMKPKVWFAQAREQHPRRRGEAKAAYAKRLFELMQNAPVTRVWPPETVLRRLKDKTPPPDDPSS